MISNVPLINFVRGHLTVNYYTDTQSFLNTISNLLAKKCWVPNIIFILSPFPKNQ